MNDKRKKVRVMDEFYDLLLAEHKRRGVSVTWQVNKALELYFATQLAQQHKPAPSRTYDEEFYAGMELLDLDM